VKNRIPFSLPLVLEIVFFVGVIAGIPFAVIQLQQQQEIRSRANEAFWAESHSAVSSCPSGGGGVVIKVTFNNQEPNNPSKAMNVVATDKQSGKSITFTNILGGQSKSGEIQTDKTTVAAGTVDFILTWTDGHSGTDKRSSNYNAVSNCGSPTSTPKPTNSPTPKPSTTPIISPSATPKPTNTPIPSPSATKTPSPTQKPSATPTIKPSASPSPTIKASPTPTICPTLGPVKNVRIECPNCP
jgi:hypothetical protein